MVNRWYLKLKGLEVIKSYFDNKKYLNFKCFFEDSIYDNFKLY